jgi:ADP-heptose:LPS heptosyltransferase
MQAERFDLALQMHGGGRYSNPFTRRLQARWSVGMRAKDAEPLDHDIPYYYFQPEVLRYLEVVSLVGAVPTRLVPSFAVTPSDEQELDSLALDPTAPLAVLHPGATDPRRRWPPAQFAAVGQALVDAGAQVAVVGAGDERQLVRAVLAALPSDAHDLCDRLTLGGLAALLARSRVVVANDSGPLHLADAVGTCTVGVFWCGNMINGGPTTRRRHRPVISWRLTCPVCERNTLFDNCAHRVSFVADAPLADAKAAALELLGTGTPLYSASRSEKSAGGASRGNGAAAP